MVSFQRRKGKQQFDCFFALLNLRIFPYSVWLDVFPVSDAEIYWCCLSVWFLYTQQKKIIPKIWSIYSALFLRLCLLFPYVKSFQILLAFLLTQHCFLLLTQFTFYKPLSFPYQSHILGQWFFKLVFPECEFLERENISFVKKYENLLRVKQKCTKYIWYILFSLYILE